MECPHCLVSFHDSWSDLGFRVGGGFTLNIADSRAEFSFASTVCPDCNQLIFKLYRKSLSDNTIKVTVVYPKATVRLVPPEVDEEFANDFTEACLVIGDSEKASAALSRRCLQNILREKAETKAKDLVDQIQEILDSGKLPSHLAEAIDGVRVIGNFASHPIKSKNTGEVIEVESGEAEWLLETLAGLFDFYFVQPAKLKEKRDALNKKLKEAGKPQLKSASGKK